MAAVKSTCGSWTRVSPSGLFELQTGGSRLLPMEGLRGFSAFLVFFVHFVALFGARSLQTPLYGVFRFLGTLGHSGVDVFFVLSGFIVYGMLLKKRRGYIPFVRRRIVRLYPTFLAIFLIYVAANLALPSHSRIPASPIPAVAYLVANFLMLPGIFAITPMISVAWSLSYELCFYLTIPLLFSWLNLAAWRRRTRVSFFLFLCAGWLALWRAGLTVHPRLIMFGCGILLCEAVQANLGQVRFGSFAALALFIIALTLAGLRGQPALTQGSVPIVTNSAFSRVLLFVSTFALGYFTLGGTGWLAKWFSWNWLRWFGNMSYSYYLFHGLILSFLKPVAEFVGLPQRLSPVAFLALCVACFAATVLGSAVVFLTIEKRFSFRTRTAGVAGAHLLEPKSEVAEGASGSPG